MANKTQTDFLGQEVAVGDYVVSTIPYVKGLALARVERVTPKGVTVEYLVNGRPKKASRFHGGYAKVDPEDALAAVLTVGLDQ